MKHLENVDLKQHFREFYLVFLPIFVFVGAVALVLWVTLRPPSGRDRDGAAQSRPLVGLLNAGPRVPVFDPAFAVFSPIEMVAAPRAVRFDSPMGTEHFGLTYNAQPFLTTRHLGDDINGIGGGDSDLGDPVYAVADGTVVYAAWPSDGWGNVVVLLHERPSGEPVNSFYGHLDRFGVFVGQRIRRGEKIGEVGTARGRYLAHLHFELRTAPVLDCGAGYADSTLDRLPGEFSIMKWRGRPDDRLSPAPGLLPRTETEAIRVDTRQEP